MKRSDDDLIQRYRRVPFNYLKRWLRCIQEHTELILLHISSIFVGKISVLFFAFTISNILQNCMYFCKNKKISANNCIVWSFIAAPCDARFLARYLPVIISQFSHLNFKEFWMFRRWWVFKFSEVFGTANCRYLIHQIV